MQKAAIVIASIFLVEVIAVAAYLGVRSQNGLKQMKTDLNAREVWAQERAVMGSPKARFNIIEFGDYQCPPCRTASQEIEAWSKKEPDLFRFQFRNYPLAMHAYAVQAAEWIEGLDRQTFWMAHNDLYRYQGTLNEDLLAILSEKYKSSRKREGRPVVQADLALSQNLGLSATPAIFVIDPNRVVYRCGSVDQARFIIASIR